MKKIKKEYKRPELIVLTRTKPEEHVLLFCKTGEVGQGPDGYFGACTGTIQGGFCQEWTPS